MRKTTSLKGLVESPVLSDGHAGFGGRPEETGWSKDPHRASGRPYVVCVSGERQHAEALRDEVAQVLAPLGLRLAPDKTRVVHVDEGFDFLGFHIRRMRKYGSAKRYVYTVPSRKAVAAVTAKVRARTARSTLHRKHGRISWREVRARFCDRGWRFAHNGVCFRGASSVAVTRYRYRGTRIPTPWTITSAPATTAVAG